LEALFRLCDLLCGLFLLLQVALSDRLFLDLSPSSENDFIAPEVDVSKRDVVQALVEALTIVMIRRLRVYQADHFKGASSHQQHAAARGINWV